MLFAISLSVVICGVFTSFLYLSFKTSSRTFRALYLYAVADTIFLRQLVAQGVRELVRGVASTN